MPLDYSPLIRASGAASAARNSGQYDTAPARGKRPVWVWWHLLSLDAATVAVIWCWFLAAAFHLHLSECALPTLALGTWCVYVADRLLDGWLSRDTATLRDRHWFYLRHRGGFLIAWFAAAVPLAYLIFFRVQPRVRTDDIILFLIGVAYFLLIHGRRSESSILRTFAQWLPKELAVGFLFAIAAAVPVWSRLAAGRGILLAAVFMLGAACWLNCVAIQTWEDSEAANEIVHSILSGAQHANPEQAAGSLTTYLGDHLTAFAVAVGTVSFTLAALSAATPVAPLFISTALSALLFLGLIRYKRRFSTLSLRIAADAALLTPLIFLLRLH